MKQTAIDLFIEIDAILQAISDIPKTHDDAVYLIKVMHNVKSYIESLDAENKELELRYQHLKEAAGPIEAIDN